jgi:signal transduction histidine kinase
MDTQPGERVEPLGRARAAVLSLACVGLVVVVGVIDRRTSAYIAFSIFYFIPISLAAWSVGRTFAVAVAIGSATTGFVADVVGTSPFPATAYVNLGLRIVLFTLGALIISRVQRATERERELAERARDAALGLAEANRAKEELMRSVARDVRAPLADVYAGVVTLGFEIESMSPAQLQEALREIATASRAVSESVARLLGEEPEEAPARPEAGAGVVATRSG